MLLDDNGTGLAPNLPTTGATQADAPDYEAMVAELRQEAAARRMKAKELEAQLNEVRPLAEQYQKLQEAQKGETERMAEKLAALEAKLKQAETQAEYNAKRQKLTLLASKSNVSADVISLLNLEAFNLDDEAATLEALAKLAPSPSAPSNAPTNAARNKGGGISDGELRAWLFGNKQAGGIFGG
jgi:chromosome segregation ATPase